MSPGYPVEPAAHRKVSDRDISFTQLLDCLGRYLDVSEQPDVIDVGNADLPEQFLLVTNLQRLTTSADTGPWRIEIERTPVRVWRDQPAQRT